jgi:predicted membrane channel-forming protein YqfA (hemolysin III family)
VKQNKPRIWLGAIYSQSVRAQFYIGLAQLSLVAVAAIRTIQEWLPWVTFPLLLAGLFIVYVLAGVLDYIFAMSSVVAFQNEQICKHDNPVIARLQAIEEQLGIEVKDERK